MSVTVPPVLCPACNARERAGHDIPVGYRLRRPIDSPMELTFVSHPEAKPASATCAEPIPYPHFLYVCPRCHFAEIHVRAIYTEDSRV